MWLNKVKYSIPTFLLWNKIKWHKLKLLKSGTHFRYILHISCWYFNPVIAIFTPVTYTGNFVYKQRTDFLLIVFVNFVNIDV